MKIRHPAIVFIFLFLFSSTIQFAAQSTALAASPSKGLNARSSITEVTVFTDRALVTRSATLELKPGTHEVVFDELPLALWESSVRVSAEGTARARITGIDLEKTYLEKQKNEEVEKLEDRLEKLRDDDRGELGRLKNLKDQRKFLEAIKLSASKDMTEDVERGKVGVGEWQGILDFYLKNLDKIDEALRAVEILRRDLAEKIRDLTDELNSIKWGGKEGKRTATVGVEVSTIGSLTLKLSYMMGGASWTPSYDVRAGGAEEGISITTYGEVVQRTGEEWNNVRLTLSTARASVGAEVPELLPWYLEPVRPAYKRKSSLKKRFRVANEPMGGILFDELKKGDMVAALEEEVAAAKPARAPAPAVTARVREGWTSSAFEIKKRADIEPDGTLHRVTVAIDPLKADFFYETVPKLSELVFLKAKVKNTSGHPLLSGSASVFVEDNFIGKGRVKTTAPDEDFEVSLGADEGVKVERKTIKKVASRGGVLSKRERKTYAFTIELENLKKKEVELTVIDQLPVGRDKAITIKLVKIEPKPEPDEGKGDGLLKWKLLLKPGEKKEIGFEYYIDYPKGMVLGL